VAAGEKEGVSGAKTLSAAMLALIKAHPLGFARRWLAAGERGRVEAALFRLKARSMAADYSDAFSGLARAYGVTIVGGSILLPCARVAGGRVEVGDPAGPLQNVCAVFGPDGCASPALARKCFPTADELSFTAPARCKELPVYETPAGRLGVLVCADSWFPQAYMALARQRIDLLAVPSLINHAGAWEQGWGGYSGWPDAADVDPADIQRISEGQAWGKYALAGRLASSGARAGVNVFLQGELWDLRTDGRSVIVRESEINEIPAGRAGLLNLWIEKK
jgi:predicted amidohydrolase